MNLLKIIILFLVVNVCNANNKEFQREINQIIDYSFMTCIDITDDVDTCVGEISVCIVERSLEFARGCVDDYKGKE